MASGVQRADPANAHQATQPAPSPADKAVEASMTQRSCAGGGFVSFALWTLVLSACAKGISATSFDNWGADDFPDAAADPPGLSPAGLVPSSDAAFATPSSPDPSLSQSRDAAAAHDGLDNDVRDETPTDPSGTLGVVSSDDADAARPDASGEIDNGTAYADAGADAGSNDDAIASARDDSGASEPIPLASNASPGDLLITEIMFAPWGPEPQSEWFEIYNTTVLPTLLSGLTIEDGYPRTHLIAASPPVIVPAQSYVVLVRDRAVALANLVPEASIAYEYGTGLPPGEGIQLENGTSGGLSLWNGATELVNVPYGSWDMASYGQSIELQALQYLDSDSPASWCIAQSPWADGSDDGTPGADNDCP